MRKNIFVYFGISLFLFAVIRLLYPYAGNDDLKFLLVPINAAVEIISGTNSVYASEYGFYFQAMNITIDKSCSGYHFALITFLLISFVLFKRNMVKRKWMVYPLSMGMAYIITIITSISRIAGHILMVKTNLFSISPNNNLWIHHFEGIFIEILFLIACYLILSRIGIKRQNKNLIYNTSTSPQASSSES